MDIVEKLLDLHKQATTERSHYYVASCCREAIAEIEKLRHPFRNADRLDWEHLFRMIPDSGHGKFWKAVFAEMKLVLDAAEKCE